jgi:hypothetical protein
MMPYGTEFVPVSDAYGRPLMAMAPMEAVYPPYVNNFGPSTPHSFQGSQSSAHADDSGTYGHFPTGQAVNGANGQTDDTRHRGFNVASQPRIIPNPAPPPHVVHQMINSHASDGLSRYMQAQFAEPTFSDCTLELRYADDRAAPVRIPGHRLILARSQTLQALLRSNTPDSSPHGLAQRTVLLQSDDKYLRSDAFWMAVQRLYSLPLLELPPQLPQMGEGGDVTLAGTASDRFDFALGYIAAGHILRWEPVVVRGVEIATQLLSWATIERALQFALGDVPSRGTVDGHSKFPYGEPTQFLLNGIISFIIDSFPPNFFLDTSVTDPEKYARLPSVPAAAPSAPMTPKANGPTIARGTSVHLAANRRPRLQHIKFGDLSPAASSSDGNYASLAEATSAPPQPRPASHVILSRVLLNLPFAFLKPALESGGQGNVSAWANAEARHRVIRSVIAEREARRLRAADAVKAGRIANPEAVRYRLGSVEPRSGGEWDTLGWQEEVMPFGNADTPSLVQKWVPMVPLENANGANGVTGQTPLPKAEYP